MNIPTSPAVTVPVALTLIVPVLRLATKIPVPAVAVTATTSTSMLPIPLLSALTVSRSPVSVPVAEMVRFPEPRVCPLIALVFPETAFVLIVRFPLPWVFP